jgi:hypothetical protein
VYSVTHVTVVAGHRDEFMGYFAAEARIALEAGDPLPILLERGGDTPRFTVLKPAVSATDLYSDDRGLRLAAAARRLGRDLAALDDSVRRIVTAEEEEIFQGPPIDTVEAAAVGHPVALMEQMVAKPGYQDSLASARERINRYRARLGLEETLLFRRMSGAKWTVLGLTWYADREHLDHPSRPTAEDADAAAKAVGFSSSAQADGDLPTMTSERTRDVVTLQPAGI